MVRTNCGGVAVGQLAFDDWELDGLDAGRPRMASASLRPGSLGLRANRVHARLLQGGLARPSGTRFESRGMAIGDAKYRALSLRRRRAQIAARHALDGD